MYEIGAIINGTTEPLEFHDLIIDGSVSIQQLHASNLTVERINGQSFEFVLNDVVRTNSDRVIESVKIIGTLSAEAVTAERVNGILVKDALVDGDLHIFGDLTIYNTVKVSGDVLVNGTVNGIDLDSQLMTFDQLHGNICLKFSCCCFLNNFSFIPFRVDCFPRRSDSGPPYCQRLA